VNRTATPLYLRVSLGLGIATAAVTSVVRADGIIPHLPTNGSPTALAGQAGGTPRALDVARADRSGLRTALPGFPASSVVDDVVVGTPGTTAEPAVFVEPVTPPATPPPTMSDTPIFASTTGLTPASRPISHQGDRGDDGTTADSGDHTASPGSVSTGSVQTEATTADHSQVTSPSTQTEAQTETQAQTDSQTPTEAQTDGQTPTEAQTDSQTQTPASTHSRRHQRNDHAAQPSATSRGGRHAADRYAGHARGAQTQGRHAASA
jgi:hypothetical protein